MRLIVQRGPEGFRAWLRDDRFFESGIQVQLPGVTEVIGWDADTSRRMGWPEDVFVRWEHGSVTFPRELVDVLPDAQPELQDGRTVEGAE